MTHQEYQDLCAVHALGALDGDERAALESHLAGCAACRRLVAEHTEAAAGLSAALAPMTPSPALRRRVTDAISASNSGIRLQVSRGGVPMWAIPAAAAASLLAGVWFGKKMEETSGPLATVQQELAKIQDDNRELRKKNADMLAKIEASDTKLADFMAKAAMAEMEGAGEALAKVFWKNDEVHMMATGLPAAPKGMGYQLWALAPGKDPMPGDVFQPNAEGALVAAQPHFKGIPEGSLDFAVTLEPIAGVKAPTGTMVLKPKPKK